MSKIWREWNERAGAALRRGEFQEALEGYLRAREAAEESDDDAAIDKAELNLAMVRLQIGEPKRAEEGLRAILLRATDDRVAFSAAYNLAGSLRKQGRLDRALAYARRAMERASALEVPELVASVHTLLGNILLQQGELDGAMAEYETSLEIRVRREGDARFQRAILEENIGYCLLLQRRIPEGIARLDSALALAEEVGDARCRAECLQDLCYAHLLLEDPDRALEPGRAALVLAADGSFSDIEENCHYLLGEIGSRTGDTELRDRHFGHLQSLHPEVPRLREFLCAVDVTGIITLKR